MHAIRSFSPVRIALAAAVGAMLLSSASYAQNNRHEQIFPQGARGSAHYDTRAHYQAGSNFNTPNDYVSSHVCINGYRYITRETDRWDNPAQNAIPVRC